MRDNQRIVILALSLALVLPGCSGLDPQQIQQASVLAAGGNAKSGRAAIRRYGCNTCHTVSGVPGARGLVGPVLDGVADRSYIAGELPNTPANMMRWIQHPQEIKPHTVMPEMGVTEDDSRNIAAYLYTRHANQPILNSF